MSRFPLFFYSHFSFSILPTVRASFHFQLSDAHQIFCLLLATTGIKWFPRRRGRHDSLLQGRQKIAQKPRHVRLPAPTS
jgi:hypothetical protein